jgi:hypothetical protein
MPYDVPDVERDLGELAGVLRPRGRLVAVTNGDDNLADCQAARECCSRLVSVFVAETAA